MSNNSLPHWTWDDLDAVLTTFTPQQGHPLQSYLMEGLIEEAHSATPQELLRQVLSAGWVMAQVGVKAESDA